MLCNVLRWYNRKDRRLNLRVAVHSVELLQSVTTSILQTRRTSNRVAHAVAQGDVGAGAAGLGTGMVVFMQALVALCSSCTELLQFFLMQCPPLPSQTSLCFLRCSALMRQVHAPPWLKKHNNST